MFRIYDNLQGIEEVLEEKNKAREKKIEEANESFVKESKEEIQRRVSQDVDTLLELLMLDALYAYSVEFKKEGDVETQPLSLDELRKAIEKKSKYSFYCFQGEIQKESIQKIFDLQCDDVKDMEDLKEKMLSSDGLKLAILFRSQKIDAKDGKEAQDIIKELPALKNKTYRDLLFFALMQKLAQKKENDGGDTKEV